MISAIQERRREVEALTSSDLLQLIILAGLTIECACAYMHTYWLLERER